jgi:hypothetical protein
MRVADIISEFILIVIAMSILVAIGVHLGCMTSAEGTIANLASSLLNGVRTGTKYLLRKGK